MKTLFIDDDEMTLRMIEFYCKSNNIDADFITNPKNIYKFDLTQYDLLITDYMMPELNGIELCKYAKSKNDKLMFAFITAISNPDVVDSAYGLNVIDYIVKPISCQVVKNILIKAENKLISKNFENTIIEKINKL